EARRNVGARGAAPRPHPGEAEGRRVPRRRRCAGARRPRTDRYSRDPHLEHDGGASGGARPTGVRPRSRRCRALGRRDHGGADVAEPPRRPGSHELSQDHGREGVTPRRPDRSWSRLGRLPRVRSRGGRAPRTEIAALVHHRRRQARAPRPDLPRLPPQRSRRHGHRRLLDARASGRARLDAAGLGRARPAVALRSLHGVESGSPAGIVAARPLEGLCPHPPDAPGAPEVTSDTPRRIFLLSPASCAGQRARLLFHPRARFDLARELRTGAGVPLGQVFSFLSGLYFRGKLEYASTYARPPDGTLGVLVMTAGDGLCSPQMRVQLDVLECWARIPIDTGEARYTEPLLRDASALRERLGDDACEVVLLGSVATGKYVDLLQ